MLGTNTSVASLVFSSDPDLSRLAAAYEDGELALFDPWNVELMGMVPDADGQTLATGNSAGMMQLFDFETLQLLYRVNAYDYGVRALAFSSDSLRFLDIRGRQCNVWEPSVLVRKEEEDVTSNAVPAEPRIIGVADLDDLVEITALACDISGVSLFCGKSDGSVCVHDSKAGAMAGALYRHANDMSIVRLSLSERGDVLASADAAGRYKVRAIRRNSLGKWVTIRELLDERSHHSINQIVLHPKNELLLVSTF